MTAPEWLCLGGPIHGQYRPAGLEMVVPDPSKPTGYRYSILGREAVAIPAEPALYRPTLVSLPGWRIKLPVWCEDRIPRGVTAAAAGNMLPGSVQQLPGDRSRACRWCYGVPLEGLETCSRVQCITAWDAVRSLDTITWRGEER